MGPDFREPPGSHFPEFQWKEGDVSSAVIYSTAFLIVSPSSLTLPSNDPRAFLAFLFFKIQSFFSFHPVFPSSLDPLEERAATRGHVASLVSNNPAASPHPAQPFGPPLSCGASLPNLSGLLPSWTPNDTLLLHLASTASTPLDETAKERRDKSSRLSRVCLSLSSLLSSQRKKYPLFSK